ncbi:MAG: GspH/FimT family pseudopilin [Gammaproteobacteria bacterium]|nr:GspH/FimT family pseudopilin [Gammaproteobacteria bacterium]
MKKQRAFTLVELMVTLAVFGILAVAAIPAYNGYVRSNRLITDTNAFVGALNFARSEAIKRNAPVSVCKSSDGATCLNNNSNWNTGWLVFVNNDNDSPAQVDAGEEIVRVYGPVGADDTLAPPSTLLSSITYTVNGFSNAQGQFILCDSTGASSARAITISRTGRPSLTTGGGTCTPS